MSWSRINRPPLWAPLTFWMQGINYLWFSGTEEAVGFIWTSARWYVGRPFFLQHCAGCQPQCFLAVDKSRQRDDGFFVAGRRVARRVCAELLRRFKLSLRTGRSGWVALPSGLTGQRGQPAKKIKIKWQQDFNPMWHSILAHQGAPKTLPTPHTPTTFSRGPFQDLKKDSWA